MGNKLVAGAGKRGRRRKVQWAGLVFVSPLLAGLLFVFLQMMVSGVRFAFSDVSVQNGLQCVAGIGPGNGYRQNIFGKQLILCDDFRHFAGDDIVEAAGRIRLDDTDFLRGILGGLRRESP